MYGFEEYVPLNEDEILKRVNQEEIIKMALGYTPIPYQRMVNPLRGNDTRAGAYFEWYNGKLFFIDFADNPTHRIPFKFISDFYNVNFRDALKIVNTYFQLGLGEGQDLKVKPIMYHNTFQHYNPEKERAHIIYKARPLQIRDKSDWFKYGITRDQLLEDQVLAGIWYKMYSIKLKKWIVIRPQDNFYIFSEFEQHVKILRPKAKAEFKWVSNCDENDIFGYSKLPATGKQCIIQKSYKDCRIIKNHGLTCAAFQNEGCIPKDEIILDLINRFDSIPIFFDNDEAGVKAAIKVSNHFNTFKPGISYPIHLPLHLNSSGITDPGDLVSKQGQQELTNFLIEKGLYGSHTINNP